MTLPMPKVGRSVDLAMRFDDYAVNRGMPLRHHLQHDLDAGTLLRLMG